MKTYQIENVVITTKNENGKISVELPNGFTGKQLASWHKRNKAKIDNLPVFGQTQAKTVVVAAVAMVTSEKPDGLFIMKKLIEIYKTRKDELVEKTIKLMAAALSGDRANRTFFFKVDEETNELTVDYLYYLGQQLLSENCFYTIKDHETPDPEIFGYESVDDMDFDACGFTEQIENAIEKKIMLIEQ
jgi:hypothetical protein